MRLKHIVLNNIYSFGLGVQCTFQYQGEFIRVLISGVNHDDPGADSNGSGKSNILNSIYWILFGEVFQEENADTIIRLGEKWCSGDLELIDDTGNILKVSRARGSKKLLEVRYNGENKTCNTDTQTQEQVLKYLQISPKLTAKEYCNDFINTTYFSSDVAKGFMGKKTTSKDRFQLVERFLNLKRYSLGSEIAKREKQKKQAKMETIMTAVAAKEEYLTANPENQAVAKMADTQSQLLTTQKQMLEVSDKIIKNNDRRLVQEAIPQKRQAMESRKLSFTQHFTALENELANNKQLITKDEQELQSYARAEQELAQKQQAATMAGNAKATLDTEFSKLSEAINTDRTNLTTAGVEINSLRQQLSIHLKCPKCAEALMLNNGALQPVDVSRLAGRLAELESQRTEVAANTGARTTKLNEIAPQVRQHIQTIANAQAAEQAFNRLRKPSDIQPNTARLSARNYQIVEEYNKLKETATAQVKELKAELTELEHRLTTLGDPTFDPAAAEQLLRGYKSEEEIMTKVLGQLEERLKTIGVTRDEITRLQKDLAKEKLQAEIYGFWEIGFRQIKMAIIDQFLPDFERLVNNYLNRLQVSLRVGFDTQKEKASVSRKDREEGRAFKEEFAVDVFKEGQEALPYGLMSKGQRGRIGSCVGMALRQLTKERGNNVFDFFFLDEIADALDESGLRELVNLLDELPGQKIVISHNDFLKDMFEERIVVEIENAVSTIREG